MRLKVPGAAREFVRQYAHPGPKLVLLLAGSWEPANYPSIATWTHIIGTLTTEFGQARVYITGVSESVGGRTATYAFAREQVQHLCDTSAATVNCYDIGLWNQIALLQASDILISPHSGFGFLALCVGTPWLALSGKEFNEYFFNRTPFYSVLPECSHYPCFHYGMRAECVEKRERGEAILCMDDAHLARKLPEIIEGVHLLLSHEFTYEKARQRHTQSFNQHLDGRGVVDSRFFEWPCWWQPHIARPPS